MPLHWTDADFDTLGWHDCRVHGFRIITRPDNNFTCDLEFDIDYILEWVLQSDRSYSFLLAPATLTFHHASQLRLSLDYTNVGMTAFPLQNIERERITYQPHVHSYRWRLVLSDYPDPKGEITFDAPDFTQTLRRDPMLHHAQSFTTAERAGC